MYLEEILVCFWLTETGCDWQPVHASPERAHKNIITSLGLIAASAQYSDGISGTAVAPKMTPSSGAVICTEGIVSLI